MIWEKKLETWKGVIYNGFKELVIAIIFRGTFLMLYMIHNDIYNTGFILVFYCLTKDGYY